MIIVTGSGWHPGVIGIVAGRLKERFGRPAIVIAEDEDGTGKGSGRSICGVDLGAAVLAAKDSGLLVAGGGHAMAAGLTLAAGRARAVARLPPRAAGRRCRAGARRPRLAARRLARAGRGRRRPVRRARRRRALWRRLAEPARRRRAGAADARSASSATAMSAGSPAATTARASSGSPSARPRPPLGQALLASPADRRWWLAGTIKRDEWNGGNAAEMHLEDAALA